MTDFFDALSLSKKQIVRIAWFGDSYVEGDIMLDPLRDLYNPFSEEVGWALFLSPLSCRLPRNHQALI